jgi:hypothetical protein
MHFHDYHLSGYEVGEHGGRITLHLVSDYPGENKRESVIEFANVAAYHFVHTGGTIITEIEEAPLAKIIDEAAGFLREAWRVHGGYPLWNDDLQAYRANLEKKGMRGWRLDSAIGFGGFIIAGTAVQKNA